MILGLAALATFIVMAMLTRALVRTPLWWLPGAGLLAGGLIELGHYWTFVANAFSTVADSRDNDFVMGVVALCAIPYGMVCVMAGGIAHGRSAERENTTHTT